MTNLAVERSGARSGTTFNLRLFNGTPEAGTLDSFTSAAVTIAPESQSEYLMVGDVIDPEEDAVVHGFTINYSVGSAAFELRTRSTLTLAARTCP